MCPSSKCQVELHDNPVLDSHVQYTDGTLTHVCGELSQDLSQYGVVRLCYAKFYRGVFWMWYSDNSGTIFLFFAYRVSQVSDIITVYCFAE